MPDYSLVPVDYPPDFSDYSLVPVDYDPFAADMIQQARAQLESQSQPLATSGAPISGDVNAAMPEAYQNPNVGLGAMLMRAATGLATLPQRAIDASAADVQHFGEDGYTPQSIGPAVETAMTLAAFPRPLSSPASLAAGTAARDVDLLAAIAQEERKRLGRPFIGESGGGWSGVSIYRGGGSSPNNLLPRPGERGLSFRDSLSNPYPLQGRPVFSPGGRYIEVAPSRLPSGSVLPDNVPPGHVTVQPLPLDVLKKAIIQKGKFPG